MKFLHLFYTFVLSLLLIEPVKAQVQPTAIPVNDTEKYTAPLPARDWCPSDQIREEALARDPKMRLEQEKFEESYRRSVSNNPISPYALRGGVLHTLPVVVHIFHSGQAVGSVENPSEANINAWIASANSKFRHTSGLTFANNPYSGVDTEIELCRVKVDPTGNPTSGIKRYNLPGFAVLPAAFDANLFTPYMWDKTKYTNLIIITSSPPDFSYAGVYYGGLDFVIILGSYVGATANPNGGLVAHEVGHYMGLGHTFSGNCTNTDCLNNGDRVCDTPPKATSGFSSPATCASPSNSCTTDADDLSTNNPFRPVANGGLGDRLDALENYMDYTGSCWAAFTQGQKARMKANLANRTTLTNNFGACTPIPNACATPVYLEASVNNSNAIVSWSENASSTSWEIKYGPAGFNPSSAGTSVVVPTKTYTLTNLALNTNYNWYVRGVCPLQPSGYSSFSAVSNFTTPTSAVYCNNIYTQPCATIAHSSGDIPLSIAGFSISKWSDGSNVLNNQNNGCLGSISDFTSVIGNVTVGAEYNFAIKIAQSAGGYYYPSYGGIWIDFNNDKDFDDANETVFVSTAPGDIYIGTRYIIPSGITNGLKRLRIRRSLAPFSGTASCVGTTSGETEEYTINVLGGVLPVELLSFRATNTEGGNQLTWQTASEINTSHFDIERSNDGIKFNKIGELKAQNKAANYNYLDKFNDNGTVYYRLTINDLDGKTNTSKIISIEKNSDKNIKITRNTEGSILIETNAQIELITITNTIGQLIKSTKEKQFLIGELNSGIYIISVKTDKGFLSQKIFKN